MYVAGHCNSSHFYRDAGLLSQPVEYFLCFLTVRRSFLGHIVLQFSQNQHASIFTAVLLLLVSNFRLGLCTS